MTRTTISFDTYEYAKDLQKAGFTEAQVEVLVKYAKIQNDLINSWQLMTHTAISFDTYEYAKDLQKAGFTEAQIEVSVKYAKIQNNLIDHLREQIKAIKNLQS